jgi:acyl carrier protein
MGLELAEIVMDAEDLFKISIPESDGERIRRAGDFHSLISKQLEQRNWSKSIDHPEGPKWTEDEIWKELRHMIARGLNVPLERVTKESRFVEDLGAG